MKTRVRFGSFTKFAMALALVIASAPYAKHYLETRRCGKHLEAISQAARVWASAHNGRLPGDFILMSNELVSPRLLLCPGDNSRDPANNWQELTSVNSSYQIYEGAIGAKDLPPEILQNMPYVQCKVHGGNYANALGNVSVYSDPMPIRIVLLFGLALVAFLGRCLWQRYNPLQGQRPGGTVAGDLLPCIEQVRHHYLAARQMAPSQRYRKGLMAGARHALRALPFFRDRKGAPQVRENPSTT